MSEVTSQLDLYPNNDLEKEFIDFFTEGVGYSRAYYEAVRRLEDGSSETYALLEVESRGSGEAYPGIGLQPLNEVDIFDAQARELNPWVVTEILKQRLYYIALANHPSRIEGLREARRSRFIPPQPQENVFIENSIREGRAITWKHLTTNLANHPIDGQPRSSRRNIYARGIYIPVGEDHAVMPFFSSETPDAVASPMATATMAAMHGFAMIPKDAQFKGEEGIVRQAEYIQQTYKWLDVMSREIFDDEATRIEMLEYWKRNVVAVVEPSVDKAMRRVQYLRQQTGINSFRIYSPEKGNDKLDVIRQIKEMSSNSIVIVGQVTTMGEIQQAENEGVDMCIGGIGGGGHCTTGEKGGPANTAPLLLWSARGVATKPIGFAGGASDDPTLVFMTGAMISLSKSAFGWTIEQPGGKLFNLYKDGSGKFTAAKRVAGEASEVSKRLGGYVDAMGNPMFVEGDTSTAEIDMLTNGHGNIENQDIISLMFNDDQANQDEFIRFINERIVARCGRLTAAYRIHEFMSTLTIGMTMSQAAHYSEIQKFAGPLISGQDEITAIQRHSTSVKK